MLSWFSTESQPASAPADDPPETPAHTFVTRAFKQAIFGTPAPPQTQRAQRSRTQSMDERRATHPPKSRSTGQSKSMRARANSLDASPAKPPGILLTPGTGGNRRKSVTFDSKDAKKLAAVRDGQNAMRKGLKTDDFNDRLRGSVEVDEVEADASDADVTVDLQKPRSSSGKYWKDKFDSLDKTTSHDMRKLKKKEEVAKMFGMSRDTDAQQLEDDLRREQSRAEGLQKQVDDYRARLKAAVASTAAAVKSDPLRRRTREETQAGVKSVEEDDELVALRLQNKQMEGMLTEQRKVASAHLKTKESEIAQLKRQLQESEASRLKVENDLAETRRVSSQHLKNKEREISRLQRSLDSVNKSDDLALKRMSAPPTSVAHDNLAANKRLPQLPGDPASDIWADAVGGDLQSSPQRSPRRRQATLLRQSDNPDYDAMHYQHSPGARRVASSRRTEPTDRAPLSARPTTLLNTEPSASETPRSKALSDERREAARRRLEERKRMRDSKPGAGAALGGLGWQ